MSYIIENAGECHGDKGSWVVAMKSHYKVGLTVLGGVLIGMASGGVIQAQAAKTKPAYVITEVEVTDPVALKKYSEKAPRVVASYGGAMWFGAAIRSRWRAIRRRALLW
ncbi:MAG TPA: DUF1330 domain-containing protein [Terriglobales bacterium]|jgi:hypothetical protein|nr:DUF1330 domain-containing protein [Terriglobales bacterium]